MLGASCQTINSDGFEIGCGLAAVGKTKDKEYGTISFNPYNDFTQTFGIGRKVTGDLVFIFTSNYHPGEMSFFNNTEVTVDQKELAVLGAKMYKNTCYELAKKLAKKDAIPLYVGASGVALGGAVAIYKGDAIASGLKTALAWMSETAGSIVDFSPIIVPMGPINAYLSGQQLLLNPDGTHNITA